MRDLPFSTAKVQMRRKVVGCSLLVLKIFPCALRRMEGQSLLGSFATYLAGDGKKYYLVVLATIREGKELLILSPTRLEEGEKGLEIVPLGAITYVRQMQSPLLPSFETKSANVTALREQLRRSLARTPRFESSFSNITLILNQFSRTWTCLG